MAESKMALLADDMGDYEMTLNLIADRNSEKLSFKIVQKPARIM